MSDYTIPSFLRGNRPSYTPYAQPAQQVPSHYQDERSAPVAAASRQDVAEGTRRLDDVEFRLLQAFAAANGVEATQHQEFDINGPGVPAPDQPLNPDIQQGEGQWSERDNQAPFVPQEVDFSALGELLDSNNPEAAEIWEQIENIDASWPLIPDEGVFATAHQADEAAPEAPHEVVFTAAPEVEYTAPASDFSGRIEPNGTSQPFINPPPAAPHAYAMGSTTPSSGSEIANGVQPVGTNQPYPMPLTNPTVPTLKLSTALKINTQLTLTNEQQKELAKEKVALRPNVAIPINVHSINPLIGRPPLVLREKPANPGNQNYNWFSEFTVDELLHNMHPDDMCGTIVIEIAKCYSGPDIWVHGNALYALLGKQPLSKNNYTKRISLAVLDLCKGDKAEREIVIQALKRDRAMFREHGQPGTYAQQEIDRILLAQEAQARLDAQRALVAKAAKQAAQLARDAKAAREARQALAFRVPTYPMLPPKALRTSKFPTFLGASQVPQAPEIGPGAANKRKRSISDDSEEGEGLKRSKATE